MTLNDNKHQALHSKKGSPLGNSDRTAAQLDRLPKHGIEALGGAVRPPPSQLAELQQHRVVGLQN